MAISVQHRIYITIAILFGACGALGYFVIYPSVIEIMETADRMTETRVGIEKKYLSGQFLRRANLDLKKVQSSAADLVKIFILKDEEYVFLPQFEKELTSRGYNVSINANDFGVLEKQRVGLSDILKLSFTVRGDFPTLVKAMETIRSLDPLIAIDRLSFRSITTKDETTGVETALSEMAVTARVYRIDPQKIQVFTDETDAADTR